MKKILLIICTSFLINYSDAQNQLAYLSYVFPNDSLNGFNEENAKQEALSRGFFGSEYKVFMYRAKRSFINEKYGFNNNFIFKQELPVINGAPCVNEDFEASPVGATSAISGWTITEGQNSVLNGSCSMSLCCSTPATGNNTWIRTTPYNTFTNIGIIPNSPLGGSKVLQMNDNFTNLGEVIRLTQTIPVTSSNSVFQFAYMCQMDGSGHFCCDNPYFNVLFYDCSNNLISSMTTSVLPSYSCALPPNSNWVSTTNGIFYHTGWQVKTVNLGSYIGSCVKVQVTVGDCDGWAHPGFCFFDSKCGSSSIIINGNPFIPGGTINACGIPAVMSAPSTMTPTIWNGPAGSGIISNTNLTVTTSVSGTYTLTTGSGTNTANNIFTLNINSVPSVSLVASSNTACTGGGTIQLTGSPSGGAYSGTGVTGNSFAPPITAGNYLINYVYTNTLTGCSNTQSVGINVSICTGVTNIISENTTVVIFPNPNNGEFTIKGNADNSITITNELGQIIKSIVLSSSNKYTSTIINLPKGIYFITGIGVREKVIVIK